VSKSLHFHCCLKITMDPGRQFLEGDTLACVECERA